MYFISKYRQIHVLIIRTHVYETGTKMEQIRATLKLPRAACSTGPRVVIGSSNLDPT